MQLEMKSLGLVISPLDWHMQAQIAKGGGGLAVSKRLSPSCREGKSWGREQHDYSLKVVGVKSTCLSKS
jgi:hypothetical protein